jgi:hypothetical protein
MRKMISKKTYTIMPRRTNCHHGKLKFHMDPPIGQIVQCRRLAGSPNDIMAPLAINGKLPTLSGAPTSGSINRGKL